MAQPTEATANIVRPARITGLRPKLSAKRPVEELADGKAPGKALMVSWAPSMLVARSGRWREWRADTCPPRAGVRPSQGTEQDEEETGERELA